MLAGALRVQQSPTEGDPPSGLLHQKSTTNTKSGTPDKIISNSVPWSALASTGSAYVGWVTHVKQSIKGFKWLNF